MKKFKVLLFYPNEPLLGIAPSNLASLAAFLKQNNIDVKLFDCTIYKKQEDNNDEIRAKLGHVKSNNLSDYFPGKTIDVHADFVKTVEEYKPDLIGISVLDSTITFSLEFLKLIKE